jgi:hypothetical protein
LQLLSLSLLGSNLGSSILFPKLGNLSLGLLSFLDCITLLRWGLRLNLRGFLNLRSLCRFRDVHRRLRLRRGHQLLVDNIELRQNSVKVLLKAVDLIDFGRVVGQETSVILPHLGHIMRKLQSTLVFALRKVVLNRVQIHELKAWLILHLLEHRVVKVGWLKQLRGGAMSFQEAQNSLAGIL